MKKRIVKYILVVLICISQLCTNLSVICYADNREDAPKETELYAKSAVLMDADSGRILYSKNGTEAMPNASTTKILTCILALEYSQTDAILTASSRAASAPKVHLGMTEGQRFYMIDMLHALMLESYNDCAVVIAEHISGSVEDFAKLMNQKAKEIGCEDTYFITPNGLDATDENGVHHTTASDLALLMRYCLMESEKKDVFRSITATRSYSFSEIDSGQSYTVTNRNAFLDMMQGAFSGKTGFTGNAGYCYVGAISRDGRTYIVALLACGWPNNRTYKWADSKKLMQYGVDNYQKVNLDEVEIDLEKVGDLLVQNGQGNRIGESTYTGIKVDTVKGVDEVLIAKEEEVKVSYQIKKNWEAPVAADTYVGKVLITIGDELLREYTLTTTKEIKAVDFYWCLKMIFGMYLNGI